MVQYNLDSLSAPPLYLPLLLVLNFLRSLLAIHAPFLDYVLEFQKPFRINIILFEVHPSKSALQRSNSLLSSIKSPSST